MSRPLAIVETAPEDCCGHSVPDLDADPEPLLACGSCGVVFYQFE